VTGEHLAPDIQELIRVLHAHGVRYLVVGGEAVIHHGYPRLTGDVDLFFEQTPGNCERLFAALAEFWGGSVPALSDASELLDPDLILQFGRPPNRIDLIGQLAGVSFRSAWPRRVREVLRTGEGEFPMPIIGLNDLLTSKRAAGRHKDLDDVDHLVAMHPRVRRQDRKRRPRRK
jgi:predicted nucleotidyltransferase